MILKIEQDHSRFKQIVRGKIKKELGKFISQGELIGKQGKKIVSIPLPQIDIPKFRFGSKQQGGVGQGEGQIGQPLGPGDEEGGQQQAGNQPGGHVLEVDVTLEEMAELLGEELELPRIQPKKSEKLIHTKNVYRGVRSTGPESLRHFKRTYKQALKRQIISGRYDIAKPIVIPFGEDRRYRSVKPIKEPQNQAVIIYMMDVSGSMGNEQKEIVRIETYWIDTWLKSQYKGLETRYIIHDAVAREVDAETFYHTRESGGTIISSAYKQAMRIVNECYNPSEWNIYFFHFSDGDNWSGSDTSDCLQIIQGEFFPVCNVFCYGQVESEYGSGQFLKDLHGHFGEENEQLITSKIENKDKIIDSIKEFLGKGK
jgi:sporulation protein YhbH